MTLIQQVARHLQNNSIGTLATDLFVAHAPEKPNTCIAVIDTGGVKPSAYIPIKEPTFQVFIRSADYTTGKTLCDSVRTALHGKVGYLINNETYFYFIHLISEPGHLGKDENGRELFSINFICKTR